MVKSKMNVNKMLAKVDRNMVENMVIFVLLVVVIGLLIRHYVNYTRSSENFSAHDEDDSHEMKIVLYFAPWCPHCSSFIKEWEKLGDSQKVNGKTVKVEKVDCDANPDVPQKEDIEGFPTVKLHANNTVEEYTGSRTASGVSNWLKQNV
tara:strand:- start:27 stop:473 length:447 start_codon:yes stop_codon:yes gene_type:complete